VGDICPVPVIKTKKAIAEADLSQGLMVIVDNEIAVQNISKFLDSVGCEYAAGKDGGNFSICIAESAGNSRHSGLDPESPGVEIAGQARNDNSGARNDSGSSAVVVISSQFMGSGDDALGKLLMKGFIFAVSQLETLPAAIIFYNGGVHHVLQSSDSVKDLQAMSEQSVKILSCGTCLNHYKVLDELAVGEVTDMYNIVNVMQSASSIIRP